MLIRHAGGTSESMGTTMLLGKCRAERVSWISLNRNSSGLASIKDGGSISIRTERGCLWKSYLFKRHVGKMISESSFQCLPCMVDDEEAGIILEIPGDPLCPVKTLKFYLGRLTPACRALFQRPKEHIYEQDTC
ncbi:DUF3504 domain-containing protein, partial [Trichonephila inaurata madagascariensis]